MFDYIKFDNMTLEKAICYFNILTKSEIIYKGIGFNDDLCYSGVYGQQVYDNEMEDGGQPVNGLLYELYSNGTVAYYSYYKNGFPNGITVEFYDNNVLKSYKEMDRGQITGVYYSWYSNCKLHVICIAEYGIDLKYTEWDMFGNVISSKLEPNEGELKIIKKYQNLIKDTM